MKYIVECRAKDTNENITVLRFAGFGSGLPDKKTANEIFAREVALGKWGAVYMEKASSAEIVKNWYRQ